MTNNSLLRKLLIPFSWIYGAITFAFNQLYEQGILKGYRYDLPILKIGNLAVGGTGKTPMTIYLSRLLQTNFKIAFLSRGYGRKTKGLKLVDLKSSAENVGDEPLLFKYKFPQLTVAVKESRAEAVPEILAKKGSIECFVLDDAFQHRSLESGYNVLLTAYDNLFFNDLLMPAGTLRESKKGIERADLIVVTKCPRALKAEEKKRITSEIAKYTNANVYFSFLNYGAAYKVGRPNERIALNEQMHVLLLTGIANNDHLEKHVLSKTAAVYRQYYKDHHYFSDEDLANTLQSFENIESENKIILTTEKDAVRLFSKRNWLQKNQNKIFVLPVELQFFYEDKLIFDREIISYVNQYFNKELYDIH